MVQLLARYASFLTALRDRGVVSSGNAPAGDYAEWLVAEALGGELVADFLVKSYDFLTVPDRERVQVKGRVIADWRRLLGGTVRHGGTPLLLSLSSARRRGR